MGIQLKTDALLVSVDNIYMLIYHILFCDSMRKKTPNQSTDLELKNLHTIREWIRYPLVRDCTPTVLMADFTNVSEEGLSKVGFRILASFVAT